MREQTGGSDYGYDQVHELMNGAETDQADQADLSGDLSYDLAHGVPPAIAHPPNK
jgi:hypothetical protein